MVELIGAVSLPLLLSLLLAMPLEPLLLPQSQRWWRRSSAAWLGHLGILWLIFAIELIVFRRPWFACSQVIFWQGLMLVVNRVKLQSLYEPFVYQDLHYFVDLFRHPRLYLPFFGLGRLVVAIVLPLLLVISALQLETPLPEQHGWLSFMLLAWLLLLVGILGIALSWRWQSPLAGLDPHQDQAEIGMLSSFIGYARAERQLSALDEPLLTMPPIANSPHLVVVQSESFFDARTLWPAIKPEVYQWFDNIGRNSVFHGPLQVPAIGANTVRTEFAFLTGLSELQQGIHRFQPYRRLAKQPISSLASRLKAQGYRTVCVHPYPITFYQRDRVYPHLGFDEFLDHRFFQKAEGPYVGDVEVADLVKIILQKATVPTFVFVITMENHGPLHLEHVAPDEHLHYMTEPPPVGCHDLTAYLRHVANAAEMAALLTAQLQQGERPGLLCWYGDHLPILPALYQQLDYQGHDTCYFIWSSQPEMIRKKAIAPRSVDQLANQLLDLINKS